MPDPIETLLLLTLLALAAAIAFLLLGPEVILLAVVAVSLVGVVGYRRWRRVRQRGIIALCSEKVRTILLERSILDIFRDLVYFPYVTKVISAYLKIAATKPHPQQIEQIFRELPKEVGEVSNKKGLLSLAPAFVEEVVLPSQNRELLPHNYGATDWKWDKVEVYSRSVEQVHEETVEKRVIHFLDGKLGWPAAVTLLALTAIGVTHMKPHRFRKMFLHNATFACMLLSLIALLVKARKVMRHSKPSMIKDKQQ